MEKQRKGIKDWRHGRRDWKKGGSVGAGKRETSQERHHSSPESPPGSGLVEREVRIWAKLRLEKLSGSKAAREEIRGD